MTIPAGMIRLSDSGPAGMSPSQTLSSSSLTGDTATFNTGMKTVRVARLKPGGFMHRLDNDSTPAPWPLRGSSRSGCLGSSTGSRRSSSVGLARVKSEMSEMQAELAAQRYLLSQSQERDAATETATNRKEARKRGYVGGLRWARASDRATLMPVVTAWHMVVESRRTQGFLRARLLEEEACREMALRQQKMELAVQHMEAEQQFREDVLSLRTLLAEAEARCAIALASPLLLRQRDCDLQDRKSVV